MIRNTLCSFLLVVWAAWPVLGQPRPDRESDPKSEADSQNHQQVLLTRRSNNGPYETAAFSFRHQTQELELHRNYVDVVFSGCGQLHINPHAGLRGRIADMGKTELDKITLADLKKVPGKAWRRFCLPPVNGHIYVHEGWYLNRRFTVAFKITIVTPEKLSMRWRFLSQQEDEHPEVPNGAAGTMGQCGGKHVPR